MTHLIFVAAAQRKLLLSQAPSFHLACFLVMNVSNLPETSFRSNKTKVISGNRRSKNYSLSIDQCFNLVMVSNTEYGIV